MKPALRKLGGDSASRLLAAGVVAAPGQQGSVRGCSRATTSHTDETNESGLRESQAIHPCIEQLLAFYGQLVVVALGHG